MDTKEKILKTSLKLFNEYGFKETPTSLISREAGIATGTLFHHFPSKDALINALYLDCKDRIISLLVNDVKAQSTFRAKVEKMWSNCILWGLNNPEDYKFFMQFSFSPYITKMTKEEGLLRLKEMNEIILEGLQQDLLKDTDPDFLLSTIYNATMSQIHYFIANPGKYEDDNFRSMAFNLIWDGFKK